MKLQTLEDVERSIGGRPRQPQIKVRQSLYITEDESQRLKALAEQDAVSLSQLLRTVVRRYLNAQQCID